jgi:hypothetical protein
MLLMIFCSLMILLDIHSVESAVLFASTVSIAFTGYYRQNKLAADEEGHPWLGWSAK